MFSRAGLEPPRQSIPAPSSSSDCDICCQSPEDLIGLDCGHRYCSSCLSRYLTGKIMEQVDSGSSVQCPGHGCAAVVEDRMVEKVVTDPAVVDKYWLLVTNIFVEQHRQMRWCPRPGCATAVRVEVPLAVCVECQCGQVFCFKCGREAHDPVPCHLMAR